MSFMELATAVQFGVDIKVVVMTNNRLGMVRELQTNGYHDRQTAVFLTALLTLSSSQKLMAYLQ